MIWGASQEYVLEGLNKVKEKLQRLNTLPAPIPDPEDDDSVEKWKEKGEYSQTAGEVAQGAGFATGVAQSIASIGKIKQFEGVFKEMESMTQKGCPHVW